MSPATPRHALPVERPLSTVDLVIFTVRDGALSVLLVRRPDTEEEPFPNAWALPGGFVDTRLDENLEACALRKLEEKTGVTAPYLEQLGSWGNARRDPRGWSATHVYFALVGADALLRGGVVESPARRASNTDAQWHALQGERVRMRLAFDHAELLRAAVVRLRSKVEYTSLPAFLMPTEFTLTELQQMYEAVLGRTLEKKSFRTRVLAADLLEPVARVREGANRPAQLYRLRHRQRAHVFARPFGNAPQVD
jgi:8-oxo-dGTP diphosphatase